MPANPPDLQQRLLALHADCLRQLNEADVLDAGLIGVMADVIVILRQLELLPTPDRAALDEAEPGDKAAR